MPIFLEFKKEIFPLCPWHTGAFFFTPFLTKLTSSLPFQSQKSPKKFGKLYFWPESKPFLYFLRSSYFWDESYILLYSTILSLDYQTKRMPIQSCGGKTFGGSALNLPFPPPPHLSVRAINRHHPNSVKNVFRRKVKKQKCSKFCKLR